MKSLRLAILLIFIGLTLTVRSNEFAPNDLPTIEALIDLHKKVAKAEKEALDKIAISKTTEAENKSLINKFKDCRETLDSKLNNVYSYVLFAVSLGHLAKDITELVNDYKDFTVNTVKYVTKKPFILWYYNSVNKAVIREEKYCRRSIVQLLASGTSIMRVSMSDKMYLINCLRGSITRARGSIARANLFCRAMVSGDWHPDYIWEILDSDVLKQISQKCASDFKANCKQ